MNTQLKTIILKEASIAWRNSKYITLVLFTLGMVLMMGYVYSTQNYGNEMVNFLSIKLCYIIIPSIAVWMTGVTLSQSMFYDEKILGIFGSILAAPISITKLWVGKICALTLLTYPLVFLGVGVLSIFFWFKGISVYLSLGDWILILCIIPLFSLIYIMLSSWLLLRFSQDNMITVLLLAGLGSVAAVSSATKPISDVTNVVHAGSILSYYSMTLILEMCFIILILLLINRLDKERLLNLR
ncbi:MULTISPECIES: hypothetical protein [Methanobacterium]|jgi:hypothetical protein|uniref:ABC transporter permease n=1 Tax=Methanobacterium bryantii TaxID=2161 RepID=A0A2A2H4R7_METBR|nr:MULTISPECIES: hypothetical protein [Methanobacterium]OEC84487.1 hypothetical protein A9507_15380 [Methanobacterium sp. A39]PAV04392.1 hypothetical protein ASJ80_05990 [Methanobacterium bryantii]